HVLRTPPLHDALPISTDATSGTLHYAAAGLPPGLKINPSSGALTGTVGVGAVGTYFVTVVAQDGTYTGSTGFAWTLNSPVTFTADRKSTRLNSSHEWI